MILKNEVWKDIIGYEKSYQISSLGNVFSKKKNIILKTQISNRPYKRVELNRSGKKKYLVHRLVALHFLKNEQGKDIVNHIDGNTENNCVDNLEWTTHRGNRLHAKHSLGVHFHDENNPNSKLKIEDVKFIRSKRNILTNKELASKFGVAPQHISHIQLKKSWKNV